MVPADFSEAPTARARLPVPADLAAQGMALRPEAEDDLPFLRRLYVSTRWEELRPAPWSDEQKLAFLSSQFQMQRLHYTTHYLGREFLVIERQGEPIGRLYLDRGSEHDLRVVDIAFLPEHRGKGYGTALLGAALQEAAAGGKVASIHVEEFNPARRLYDRLGFRPVSTQGPYCRMEKPPAG